MNDDNDGRSTEPEQRLEEAESLIWSLLDERLDDADTRRLAQMIEEDAAVRARYIECVQLHVDLREHFGRQAAEKGKDAVVLPNLLPGLPGISSLPHVPIE
jgi:anti-sigma factor RsiW